MPAPKKWEPRTSRAMPRMRDASVHAPMMKADLRTDGRLTKRTLSLGAFSALLTLRPKTRFAIGDLRFVGEEPVRAWARSGRSVRTRARSGSARSGKFEWATVNRTEQNRTEPNQERTPNQERRTKNGLCRPESPRMSPMRDDVLQALEPLRRRRRWVVGLDLFLE